MSDTEDTWYAELRAQYQPEHVRLLLIGESAPTDHGGTRPRNFFYADHLGYLGDVEIRRLGDVSGGPAMLQAIATGEADIALGPFQGAIAKVASTGVVRRMPVALMRLTSSRALSCR